MSHPVKIRLHPLGRTVEVERGAALQTALHPLGVEFPCGGRGRCAGCRVRVVDGSLPLTPAQAEILTARETGDGWRLACRCKAESDVTLEVGQWETVILADHSAFDFTPRDGLGIAVDLGTTTLVAQLLDLRSGRVLAVRTALNPQAVHGGDIMSRIQFAIEGGGTELTDEVRGESELSLRNSLRPPRSETTASTMSSSSGTRSCITSSAASMWDRCRGHPSRPPKGDRAGLPPVIWAGRSMEIPPSASSPASAVSWAATSSPALWRPGCTAATRRSCSSTWGTNGEILIGNRGRMICASTAAGPAFEGGRISMGMRATTGAISEVTIAESSLRCRVIGDVAPRGVCGSGLVDAVAAGLELGLIDPSGRLTTGAGRLDLAPPVTLTQGDVRELQLAKGAIAAGMRILRKRFGRDADRTVPVYLAGAFGNYVNRAGARRIGLIDAPLENIEPAGNTALLGAKLALFEADDDFGAIRGRVEHLSLASDPEFQEVFIAETAFPDSGS